MRILFVADGRSPIAQSWIRYFVERGDDVYLASTFACSTDYALKGLEIIPVAFSGKEKAGQRPGKGTSAILGLRSTIRHFLGPLTIPGASRKLRPIIQKVKPDLVHALRIPYEGMLAADAYADVPLIVSVWGNDFTLHAPTNPLMRHYTSWTMQVADALHTDCQRDIRLGKQWGFDPSRPTLVTPGNGGIRMDIFYQPPEPVQQPIVVNPRGLRTYIRNDIFFQAIPKVLAKCPEAKFWCAAMEGEPQAIQWVHRLDIGRSVELLPAVPHAEMAGILREAQIVVSPAIHDGTPNTLLEGMACGCLPVAGDLESIREWITPERNGLLADATNPESLADAILEGLENKNLRLAAADLNQKLILERAEYTRNMQKAGEFYERVLGQSKTARQRV